MEIVNNNRDIHYVKQIYGSEIAKQVLENSSKIEYCALLSGRCEEKLINILEGTVSEDKKLKSKTKDYGNYLFTPGYSDKSLHLFEEFGIRNLTIYQHNSNLQTITVVVNKATTIEDIEKEYDYIKSVLKRDVSFLVDSKITKRKFDNLLHFLESKELFEFRLRWRGKIATIKKLLILKDNDKFKIHLSNLNSNLGSSDRKTGRRIAVVAVVTIFRKVINSLSRGVFHFVKGDYPIYVYNPITWNVDLVEYSADGREYALSRLQLAEDLNKHINQYFDTVNSKQFAKELERREIGLF